MKQKKHATSIIYTISLILPFVLTAVLILFFAGVYFSGDEKLTADLQSFMLISAVWVMINFCLFMIIPLVTYGVLSLVQVYRMWNVLNDGKSRMTSGEAVGFLFVPFYNLYWMFQVWSGFPKDYNAFVDRYRLQQKVPYLKRDLFDFLPVLILLSGLIITIPVLLVVFAVLLKRTNIALDNLKLAVIEARQQRIVPQLTPRPVFQTQPGFSS